MCTKMERNHTSSQANDESKFDQMRTYPSFDLNRDSKTQSLRNQTIKKTPVELLRDCASRSSIHSFPSLSKQNAHPLVVVLWLVSIATSWSYLGYQIYLSIALYNTFGVATSEWIEYEVPTNFPAVDICNLNPYNGGSDQVREFYDLVLNGYQLNLTSDDYTSIREFTDDANDHFKVFVEVLALQNLTHFMEEFGFMLDQMLISCEFQGKPCAASDFYYYHDYNYGSCYRFNGGPRDKNQNVNENTTTLHNHTQSEIKKSSKAGWRNGLRLELFAGNQKSQHQFTYQTGFRVIVHNQSVIPIPDEDGIDIAVGQQTNIAIKRTFMYHQSDPYSNCIYNLSESNAEMNEILQEIRDQIKMDKIEQYSQKYCLKLCFQYFVIEKCDCRSMAFPYLHLLKRNASECFKHVDFACLKEIDDLFYNTNQINRCYDSCPIECDSVVYDFETHTASYPTEWYSDMAYEYGEVFPSTGQSRLENLSTAMLNIFYDSMEYKVLTETPILSFELLLANIGGNLGLFTGMSVLSLVEFIEAILALGIASIFSQTSYPRAM